MQATAASSTGVVMEMAFEGTEPVLKPLVDSDEAPSNEQEADRIGEAASKIPAVVESQSLMPVAGLLCSCLTVELLHCR